MSTISSVNSISLFDSKTSVAATGCILLVSKGSEKLGKSSICASVLPLTAADITSNIDSLMPHIQAYLKTERIKLMRAIYDSGKAEIREEQVGIAAIIEALEASSRLTQDQIKSYLANEEERETLKACFAEKLGYSGTLTSDQETKLTKLAAGLAEKLAELASGKIVWSAKEQEKALEYIGMLPESGMQSRLVARIEAMNRKVEKADDIMEALGF